MVHHSLAAIKQKGKIALISASYTEAWQYLTDAINLLSDGGEEDGLKIGQLLDDSREEASLYSKRSVALLKLKQYYFAYEDAKRITVVAPEWFKGEIGSIARFPCS